MCPQGCWTAGKYYDGGDIFCYHKIVLPSTGKNNLHMYASKMCQDYGQVFPVSSMTLCGVRIFTCHINLPTLYGGFDILASFVSSRTCHPVDSSPTTEAR